MYEVIALAETDLDEVRSFLHRVFSSPGEASPPDHPPFQIATLRWKGFAPHPFWEGSRSYGVRHQGKLVAHGMLLPLKFLSAGGEQSAQVIIDWAADAEVRGGGVAIYQALSKLAQVQIGIGGSAIARGVLPRMRFQIHQTIGMYERRERLVAHHLAGPLDWKTPLRLGRDWVRRQQSPAARVENLLKIRRVDAFPTDVPMPRPYGSGIYSMRTPEFLNYLLQCPAARMEGHVFEGSDGRPLGYALLSFVRNSMRIADLWIEGDPAAPVTMMRWRQAIETAVGLGRAHKDITVVLAAASTPLPSGAFEQQGFRQLEAAPVFMRGQRPAGDVALSMADNDAFYLP